jgi:hypothetical protein
MYDGGDMVLCEAGKFTQTQADVRLPQSLLHPSVVSGFAPQSGPLVGNVENISAKLT